MQQSLIKNFIYKFNLNFFRILFPILILPYIYRVLGPEGMGEIGFSEALVGYFVAFATFGIPIYGLREVSINRGNQDKVNRIFTNLFSLSLISSFLIFFLFLGIIFLKNEFREERLLLLVYSFKIISLIFFVEWINEAYENYRFISLKTIILRVISLVLMFIVIKNPKDIYIYAFINIGYDFFNNIVSFIYVKKSVKFKPREIDILKLLKPLFVIFLMINANIFYFQMDKILLGVYSSKESVAYYTLAEKITFIILGILTTINQVTIPRLSFYYENNREEFYQLLKKIYKSLMLLIIPSSFGLFLVSKEIIYFFGGTEYLQASQALKIFAVYIVVDALSVFLINQIMFILKKEKLITVFLLTGGVINLGVKLILRNHLNLSLVLGLTVASKAFIVFLAYFYIKKLDLKIKIINNSIIYYFISSLIFFTVGLFLNSFIESMFYGLIIKVSLSALLYGLTLFIFKEEVSLEILKKIKRGRRERDE